MLLQDRIAALLGKEAAVFLPSGTMCNQIALLVHCRAGDEVIAADMAHIFTSEAGGGSALAGAQTWPLATKRGIFTGAEVEMALRDPSGRHGPRSRLVAVEQTVNRGGGCVWPLHAIEDVARIAHRHGLAMHWTARVFSMLLWPAASRRSHGWAVRQRLGRSVERARLPGRRGAGRVASVHRTRLGNGSTGSVVPCANQACWLPLAFTPGSQHRASGGGPWQRSQAREMLGNLQGIRIMNPEIETNIVFIDPSAGGHGAKDIVAGCSSTACAWQILRRHAPSCYAPRRHGRRHGGRAEAFAQALRRRGR